MSDGASTLRERPAVLVAVGVTVLCWASVFVGIRSTQRQFTGAEVAAGRADAHER